MAIEARNLRGSLVTRRLYSRVQPERIEMKVMAGAAVSATIPLLMPVTQSATEGVFGLWVPNSRIDGFVWPETYVQNVGISGTNDTIASIMTAGAVHIEDILEAAGSLMGGAGVVETYLYQDLLNELKDMKTNVRDDLHILGVGAYIGRGF